MTTSREVEAPRLNALVVDDEPPARRRLTRMLEETGRVHVAGAVGSVEAARKSLEELEVDVAFVDVQMPGKDGFALLERDHDLAIVFVTAYSEYAVRAFEVEAVDYLLKPVEPERLGQALARVDARRLAEQRRSTSENPMNERISLPVSTGLRFIKSEQIVCILARDDYTEVVLDDGSSELVSITMKNWEERLPESQFMRAHRGTIVARAQVIGLERDGSRWQANLRAYGIPVKLSREAARKWMSHPPGDKQSRNR